MTTLGEDNRDRGRNGGFAHAALTHRHDDTCTLPLDVGEEIFQAFHLWQCPVVMLRLQVGRFAITIQQHAQPIDSENVDRPNGTEKLGRLEIKSLATAKADKPRCCIAWAVTSSGHFVAKMPLTTRHWLLTPAHAVLLKCAPPRARPKVADGSPTRESSQSRRPEFSDRGFINDALLFQPGEGTETGCTAGVVVEKLIPRLRQAR